MALDHPNVSRETTEKLDLYRRLLLTWNSRINLIGRSTEADASHRHFNDSLQLIPHIPADVTNAADLGSGAGFPGLVLAIATGIHFSLIEADRRKAAFLQVVSAETGANVTVIPDRIQQASLPAVDLITARALAPVADLLALGHPLLRLGGCALFLKGALADEELTDASAKWHMRVERFPSVTDPKGIVLRLSEVRRA